MGPERIGELCRGAADKTALFDETSQARSLEQCRTLLMRFPPPPRLPAVLVIGPQTLPRWVTLTGDALSIGRSSGNDLVIDDPGVSRCHCRLMLAGGVWRIDDLESRHGVVWRGARVRTRLLCSGDILALGPVCLMYVDEPLPEPEASPGEGAAASVSAPDAQPPV